MLKKEDQINNPIKRAITFLAWIFLSAFAKIFMPAKKLSF
jgi:hypothetical protein